MSYVSSMPYADQEKARAAKRESYRRRLADPGFRQRELERVLKWQRENPEKCAEKVAAYRARKKTAVQ